MRVIRRGVFETNSSSTHSITMCSQDEYDRWERGELLLNDRWRVKEKLISREQAIEQLKQEDYSSTINFDDIEKVNAELRDKYLFTAEEYWNSSDLETFVEKYITKNGEKIVAFGRFGYDG